VRAKPHETLDCIVIDFWQKRQFVPYEMVKPGFEAVWTGKKS